MIRKVTTLLLTIALVAAMAPRTSAHCEVPCGIYDDEARLNELAEHITTVEKAINQINTLTAEGDKNYNQIVRWITNKEEHAVKFQDIVWQYFMTQRIKPADPSDTAAYETYTRQVTLCHQLLVTAMKCKQTTDTANTQKLAVLLEEFRALYMAEHGHEH